MAFKEIKPRKTHRGGISLEFMVEGERYSFAPVIGGKFEDNLDYSEAAATARQIARDLRGNAFDKTLNRYRPNKPEKIAAERLAQNYDLRLLWAQYIEGRKDHVSPSTWAVGYAQITRLLELTDKYKLENAQALKLWLINNKPPYYAKRLLQQLNACCNWGVKIELIKSNPFEGYQDLLKKRTGKANKEIDPFDSEEKNKIISIFCDNPKLIHYSGLIKFLFNVGCRPSEALALTWGDVAKNRIVFEKAYVCGKISNRLKTEEKRIVSQSKSVQLILREQRVYLGEKRTAENDIVFPAKTAKKYIDWNNFSSKSWRVALKEDPNIKYRSPYQMRHTFITLALKGGISPQDIARHCGNSANVIFSNYAGVSRDFTMPDF